jgi:hypothetical protein
MAEDLSKSKKLTGSIFPEAAYDAAGGPGRVEEFMTPTMLKNRFLFGIPLVSPITKHKMTDEMIVDLIKSAASEVELDTRTEIFPTAKRTRLPFDPNLYEKDIWLEVPYKPIQRVIRVYIASASYAGTGPVNENAQYPTGGEIYVMPNEWVDVSYAPKGRIFVNPINPAFGAGIFTTAASSGANILTYIGLTGWVPAFWTVEAIHGFCSQDGKIPVVMNNLIGAKAALMILGQLYPLFRTTSHSLSADGLGQSVSNQFWQLLKSRWDDLNVQYKENAKKIKTITGNNLFATNV